MYSQEIYIFLWYSFTCTNLEMGPSAASLAWCMPDRSVPRFSRVAESPPWSWSSAGSPLSWNTRDAWERFGSQELLIERLLGRSTGTELTAMLPRALTASPPTHEPVFLKSSTQFVLLEAWAWDDHSATLPEEVGFWRRLSARSRAPSSQLTQVQRCWSLQLRSRVSHTAWKRKGTEGDPGG